MPGSPAVLTVTGLSTTGGFPVWYPDPAMRPFNIGIGVECSSGLTVYSIEHTFDYHGNLSSDFSGFAASSSLGAVWFQNTGITSVTGNSNGNYAFPVTAIRLNVISGVALSSGTVTTAHIIQAG